MSSKAGMRRHKTSRRLNRKRVPFFCIEFRAHKLSYPGLARFNIKQRIIGVGGVPQL